MADVRTLKHVFGEAARWHPDEEVFVQAFAGEDRRYTYREFDEDSRRVANAYLDLGVSKGDRVAFLSETIVEHAVAYFAAFEIGAVPSTIHVREAPNVVGSLIRDLEPAALVFQPKFEGKIERIRDDLDVDRYVAFDHAGDVPDFAIPYSDCLDAPAAEPDVDVSPDDPAFINFSSGTTGRPKGIVHTHEEAVEGIHLATFAYHIRRDDVVLNPFTASFIGWPLMMFNFGAVGATVVLLDDWDADRIPRLIEEEGITFANITPTQWKHILEAGIEDADTSSMDRIGYGGETMGTELFHELRETLADEVLSTYGGTEVLVAGSYLLPEDVTEETLGTVGRPAPTIELRLIEPDTRDPEAEVDRGEIGEVIIRGAPVAGEVWNDPEKTGEIFHEDGWWFSGDLARVDGNGYLSIEGRTDNMIISGGINIYAEGVEDLVEDHPDVAECAIIGVPDEEWGEAVKAYVRTTGDLTAAELDGWCRDNDDLSNYQRPKEYEFVDDLPRTNTGKLNRAALRERAGVDPHR